MMHKKTNKHKSFHVSKTLQNLTKKKLSFNKISFKITKENLYKNKNFVIDLPYGEIPEIDKSRKKMSTPWKVNNSGSIISTTFFSRNHSKFNLKYSNLATV